MIQQRANFDWMLKELADGVPGVEMIVVRWGALLTTAW